MAAEISSGASSKCDRESEWPSLDSSCDSVSAEGKMPPHQVSDNNKAVPDPAKGESPPQQASKDGAETEDFKPPAHQVSKAKNRPKGKRNWESLPVDFAVKDQREVRRYSNLPPRLRKSRSNSRSDFQDNSSVVSSDGSSVQQVWSVQPPIPPPMPPCLPPAFYQDFAGIAASYPPTSSRPPRPYLHFKDEREQRCHHIRRQVHHYFKPNLLINDWFLRQHMDDQGFVPISLIASFPKVREMTRDMDLLTEALQNSEVLEVSGDKVRPRDIPWALPNGESVQQPDPVSAYQVPNHMDNADTSGQLGASPPFGPATLWYFPVPPPLFPHFHGENVYVSPPGVPNFTDWIYPNYVPGIYSDTCSPGNVGQFHGACNPPPLAFSSASQ